MLDIRVHTAQHTYTLQHNIPKSTKQVWERVLVSQTIGFVYLTLISENDCEITPLVANWRNIVLGGKIL